MVNKYKERRGRKWNTKLVECTYIFFFKRKERLLRLPTNAIYLILYILEVGMVAKVAVVMVKGMVTMVKVVVGKCRVGGCHVKLVVGGIG